MCPPDPPESAAPNGCRLLCVFKLTPFHPVPKWGVNQVDYSGVDTSSWLEGSKERQQEAFGVQIPLLTSGGTHAYWSLRMLLLWASPIGRSELALDRKEHESHMTS